MNKFIARGVSSALLALVLSGCGSSSNPADTVIVPPPVTPGPPVTGKTGCAANADHYNNTAGDAADKLTLGLFTDPFCEEKFLSDYPDAEIPDRGAGTGGQTNPAPLPYDNLEHCARRSENKFYECKPSAGSIALLPDNRMVYFNALESTENVEFNIFKEFGDVAINDQTRVVALGGNNIASWTRPINNDGGGVSPTIEPGTSLPIIGNVDISLSPDDAARNDGALFCAHLVNLHDGRVMAAGGTDYYTELNLVELEGLKNTRIFNPANDTWTESDPMSWGRWYPTMTTLINGNVFIASGVRKLIKPVYTDRPQDSGRNETHTEIFQPGCAEGMGKWTDNGAAGQKSLPLFPRMHLLPNNKVLYAGAGQAFNPFGQSLDMALWNFMSAYDPATNSWTDLGISSSTLPGFRGSTSNIMMPLLPAADGSYTQVELLTMGGTYGLSPGAPAAFAFSHIDRITLAADGSMALATRNVGALAQPRWYGQGVLLPTGKVMLFSGSDIDEVIASGFEQPVLESELFDPATETWSVMATQGKARTYHNTGFLLPDGRVMVGGHAPIPTAYAVNVDVPTRAPQGRDPTFEIYSPPYVFMTRPTISSAPATVAPGATMTIATPDAASVVADGHVVLVRRTALTHLVDGDQRNVVLRVLSSTASSITVQLPNNDPGKNQAVLPPGYYMLFIVNQSGGQLVPSVSSSVLVTGADLSCR